jgi:hypothetical protein
MKNIKDFFESYRFEIIYAIITILTITIVLTICYIAVSASGQADFNSAQWVSNPSNPASPLHLSRCLH